MNEAIHLAWLCGCASIPSGVLQIGRARARTGSRTVGYTGSIRSA